MQRLSLAMPVFGDTALLPSQILLRYSCAPPLQTISQIVYTLELMKPKPQIRLSHCQPTVPDVHGIA